MDLDLRKYNITNDKELIAFLELFAARVPQIINTVKKMQMQNASLQNVVANERKKAARASEGIVVNNNVPANSKPIDAEQDEAVANAEAARIAQMKAASENATKVFGAHPKAQVTAGEIGQLTQKIKEETTLEVPASEIVEVSDVEAVTADAEANANETVEVVATPRKGILSKLKKK